MNTLVVAHWTEDLQWTAHIPADWHLDVVHKGIHLPNHGREPTSFLWWIDTRYEKIRNEDLCGFVQGDPFGHVVDLWDQLAVPGAGFRPLSSSTPFVSTGDGSPHHQGVPVADCHERWFGTPCPGEVEFWPGGQFRIDGATLLRHPQEFYRHVFDDLMTRDGLEPWAAERLWPTMFANERWT
jgi:hypothetical protein